MFFTINYLKFEHFKSYINSFFYDKLFKITEFKNKLHKHFFYDKLFKIPAF